MSAPARAARRLQIRSPVAPTRVERAETINVLVVRGDGRRVFRLALTQRGFLGVAALMIVAGLSIGAAMGSIYGAYSAIRQQRSNSTSLHARLAEQDAAIDQFRKKVSEARVEIESWRELHAKVLQPFGPESGSTTAVAGIGGGRPLQLFEGRADHGDLSQELQRLTASVKEQGETLRSLQGFLHRASKLMAALPSRWPMAGPINSEFGRRRALWAVGSEFHSGLDIGAPVGTPVRAPAPGAVTFAGRHGEYGLTAVIEHGHGIRSLYGHLSKLTVAVEQKVARGQVIAFSGNTGRSSGPHLHYEILASGQPVNPRHFIWE